MVERLRERGKGRAGQKIRWLDGINDSMDMSLRIGTKDSVSDKKKERLAYMALFLLPYSPKTESIPPHLRQNEKLRHKKSELLCY